MEAGYCVNATSAEPLFKFALQKLWCGGEIARDETASCLPQAAASCSKVRVRTSPLFKARVVVSPQR
jgi:hypothetical protein